jgi:hypothetical protein
MEKEILATFRAATAKPDFLTVEKLDAGLGGWGAFNLGVWAAADVIASELKKGKHMKLETTNEAHTEVDEIARKSVDMLMKCGADPANAALCSAVLLYWAGVNVQCGMPCPNRKLGAVTRMAANIPSGRVSSIPTEKQNNKISGFAATYAIYKALDEEELAPYDSRLLPLGAGGPVIGHSAIGEDHLFPKLGQKLAGIGTGGMMKSYMSVGMRPNKLQSALLGTAAALEIIHPDAFVGEEFGEYLHTRTPTTAADAAVKKAGLPEKVHIRGTNEALSTAKLVGDLAIILKDSGTPTVVGMIMFAELCSILREGGTIGAGRAGGPLVIPLHHWVTAPVLSLYLMGKGATEDEIITVLQTVLDHYFQNEDATVATNLLARKAEAIVKGPINRAIIRATEPGMTKAIASRAESAYRQMKEGKSLEDLIKGIQDNRIEMLSTTVAGKISRFLGKDIEYIRLTNVRPGAGRRSHSSARRYFAFDAHVDAEVKIDGKVYRLENVLAKAAPEALIKGDKEVLDAVSASAMAIIDLLCSGASSMDVVVCACMAAAMGMDHGEAVKKALEAADVIIAIPPSKGLRDAVELASDIVKKL